MQALTGGQHHGSEASCRGRNDEMFRIAEEYNLNPSPADVESFIELGQPILDSYARLDQLTAPSLPVKYPRSPGARPQPEDNLLGAWYWRCAITGPRGGILSGRTVAIKDNVCVAGVPHDERDQGSRRLCTRRGCHHRDPASWTPVASIKGKSACESLCFSGGSHTSDTGPVRNTHNHACSAGGSSGGSGALVAAGEVDNGHRRRPKVVRYACPPAGAASTDSSQPTA